MENIEGEKRTWLDDLDTWSDYCNLHRTDRSSEHYCRVLNKVAKFVHDDGGLFTTDALEEYLYSLTNKKGQPASRRTYNAHLTPIRSFCKWRAARYNVDDPSKCINFITQDAPNQRYLTQEEYEKVLGVVEGIDRDIFLFLCHTGLRRNEFQNLKWSSIAPHLSTMTIQGKGRKVRTIPLDATCKEILGRYRRTDGKVQFVEHYKGRKSSWWRMQQLAKKADILHFGPQACRHYFATQLIVNGAPMSKVALVMGHSSVKTTERFYIHLVPKDVLGLTDVLDQRPHLPHSTLPPLPLPPPPMAADFANIVSYDI